MNKCKEILSGIKLKPIHALLILMFAERLVFFLLGNPFGTGDADDTGYVESAKYLAQTGILSIWSTDPTAIIMPGISFLGAFLYKLFMGSDYFIACTKLILIILGCLEANYIYKSARLFLPEVYALLAAAGMLLPNHAWSDTLFSTETGYMCFFCGCLYYSLMMSRCSDKKYLFKYSICFVLGLCFRANMVLMPVFTALFLLLCRRYTKKQLFKYLGIFAAISMVFFLPWTIRNYMQFDAFLPLGAGASHPTLEGSYHGEGAPTDEELDYAANVDQILLKKYSKYFDENGNLRNPSQGRYVDTLYWKLKLNYRLAYWIKTNPLGFLKSYLFIKPSVLPFNVYYWGIRADVVMPVISFISKLNFVACVLGLIISFISKKLRELSVFFALLYWVNIYIMAASLPIARYAALVLPVRMLAGALGLYLIIDFLQSRKYRGKQSV